MVANPVDDEERHLPASRKARLAAYVTEAGQVTVAALATSFGVSADTIRRDLDQLDNEGVLIRTHGGAIALQAALRPDTAVDVRSRMQSDAKDRIGAAAAELIPDGAVVIINAGSTALALVRHLQRHRDLTIATNNLRAALEINPDVCRDLHLFGGRVRISGETTTGPVSLPSVFGPEHHEIRADFAFISVGGVSADDGFSTSHIEEAGMMAEMMARSDKVAVLADHSKFGRRLFARVAELQAADYLVTDATPPAELAEALAEAEVEVALPGS